jgi:hypothetical protein
MRRPIDPTTYRLLRDVSSGIRVLQSRDGVLLSENQILERASNIVMGLLGNYRVEELEPRDSRAVGEGRATDPAAEDYSLAVMAAE